MAAVNGLRINYPQNFNSHESNNINSQHINGGSTYEPYFQRIGTQDLDEIQQCHAMIDSLQQRVNYLEQINLNLESRLEKEAKLNIAIEKECSTIENEWKSKCNNLELEIEKLNLENAAEHLKNERLREHLSRTERELYSILQRKYELMRGGSNYNKQLLESGKAQNWESGIISGVDTTTPQQIKMSKDIRQKQVISNLAEFLGI